MSVIARFRVHSVHPFGWGTAVSLSPVVASDEMEDEETLREIRSFYDATPNGQLTMTIRNEAAEEQFQVDDEFYLRLDKVPTDQTTSAVYERRHAEWEKEQKAKRDAYSS